MGGEGLAGAGRHASWMGAEPTDDHGVAKSPAQCIDCWDSTDGAAEISEPAPQPMSNEITRQVDFE